MLLPLPHPSLFLPKDKQADRDAGEQHRDSSTWKVNSSSLQHKGPYPCGTIVLRSPGEHFHPQIVKSPRQRGEVPLHPPGEQFPSPIVKVPRQRGEVPLHPPGE